MRHSDGVIGGPGALLSSGLPLAREHLATLGEKDLGFAAELADSLGTRVPLTRVALERLRRRAGVVVGRLSPSSLAPGLTRPSAVGQVNVSRSALARALEPGVAQVVVGRALHGPLELGSDLGRRRRPSPLRALSSSVKAMVSV